MLQTLIVSTCEKRLGEAVLTSSHNLCFGALVYACKPQIYYINVGYTGMYISWTCFQEIVSIIISTKLLGTHPFCFFRYPGTKRLDKTFLLVYCQLTTKKYTINMHKMSRVVRKPDFCLGENKGADQLRSNSNCEADQRLCFRYSDSTIPLLLIAKISSL